MALFLRMQKYTLTFYVQKLLQYEVKLLRRAAHVVASYN